MVPHHVRLLRLIAAAAIALALPGSVSAFEKYLPDKTEVVVGLNIRQVIEAPPVKKYGPALMAEYWGKLLMLHPNEGFRRLFEDNLDVFQGGKVRAGEPLAMLAEHVTGFFAVGPFDGKDEDALYIVQGKFEADKAKEFFQRFGDSRFLGLSLKTEKVGERELYEVVPPKSGKGLFVAVADNQHILFAESKEWMLASLASSTGNGKPKLNEGLRALLGKVDRSQSAWLVASPAQDPELEGLTAGVRIASDVRIEVNVIAKSANDAQRIAQEAKADLGQLSVLLTELTREHRELAPLVTLPKEAKITQEGKVVQFEGHITAPVVEDVLKSAAKER